MTASDLDLSDLSSERGGSARTQDFAVEVQHSYITLVTITRTRADTQTQTQTQTQHTPTLSQTLWTPGVKNSVNSDSSATGAATGAAIAGLSLVFGRRSQRLDLAIKRCVLEVCHSFFFAKIQLTRTLRRQMDKRRTVTKDPYNPEFKEAFQCFGMSIWIILDSLGSLKSNMKLHDWPKSSCYSWLRWSQVIKSQRCVEIRRV